MMAGRRIPNDPPLVRAIPVKLGQANLNRDKIPSSRWTVIISKQMICTAKFKFKTLHVQKCPSRRRNLVSIEVRPGQDLPEWL